MHSDPMPQTLARGVQQLLTLLSKRPAKILLFGPPGSGKSTLAATLAAQLAKQGQHCSCLSADPGSPAFGLPAAVNLGTWRRGGWQLQAFEALCSLDAARFRLPLLFAVRRLLLQAPADPLLVDMPGVVAGVAGAELLIAFAEAVEPEQLVVLTRAGRPAALPRECASLPLMQLHLIAADAARQLTKPARAARRTEQWEHYLAQATAQSWRLEALALLGTPPPLDQPQSWQGRVVALGNSERTLAMGEVVALQGQPENAQTLTIRSPAPPARPTRLLVRDALRCPGKTLRTAKPFKPLPKTAPSLAYADARSPSSGPQVHTREGVAELVNGIFADPLLLLSLHQSRRCLLFDLGDTRRLPLHFLHRVSDVFISHAHIDHIGGFMGLLRARLGAPADVCRLYGPPGLAANIQGLLSGILWDRIGEDGPVFEVAELHGKQLRRCRLQAGHPHPAPLPDRAVNAGVILLDPRFQMRAELLDHRTPVLAYAFEPMGHLKVRTEMLAQLGQPPGPWLTELKKAHRAGDLQRKILLPDGQGVSAAELSQKLLRTLTGDKLVYATDLLDTPDNRCRLVGLAQGAHTLFCEACFANADQARAWQHGHLTTRACGEIAASAGVQQLAPFHFSKRYEGDAARLYAEIGEAFGRLATASV